MPFVWQSALRKGGSQITRSNLALISAVVLFSIILSACTKAKGTLTRKTGGELIIIVDKFLKDIKPFVVFKEIDLRIWV